MSFREKIAWTAFLTTLIGWGSYFALVLYTFLTGSEGGMWLFWLFIGVVAAQIVVIAIAAAIAAALTPGDAKAARDERDREIARKANGVAYFIVLLGLVAVIVGLHVGLHGTLTIFALLALFVVGEATRFGAQAIGYRVRG
jgi:uncharacterized membrane protein